MTVNQSQIAIWTWKPRPPASVVGWRPVALPMATIVTRTAVISTTNITGFRISDRGSSLPNAWGRAARSCSGSRTPRGRGGSAPEGFWPPSVTKRWNRRVPRPRSTERRERWMVIGSEGRSGVLLELLDDRPEREGREERQGSDDDHDTDEEDRPQGAGRREGSQRRRDAALRRHRAGHGEDRHDHSIAADEHGQPARDVVEGRVAGQARERRPIVGGLARERVEDLAEAVGTLVEGSRRALRQDAREGGEAEDAGAEHQRADHRHLDLERLDLLAEIFRRPADHLAGDEHGENRADDQHPVDPGPDPARADLSELHVEERDEA